MSYQIHYTPNDDVRYPQAVPKRKIKWGKAALFSLCAATCLWVAARGVPDFLIPGDPVVTKTAAACLVSQLRDGVPMDEAVAAFCEQIMDGAQQ